MSSGALDGLDDVAWDALTHAYGSAEDVPRMLRDAVGPNEEAAKEALEELVSSISHQGTLYSATAAAVPFLIALVAEPSTPRRLELVWQLGFIAESGDADPQVLQEVRAALAAGTERLLPLLADPDVSVRQSAVFVVGHLAAGDVPLGALRDRRADENDDETAAGLLAAAGRLHPRDAAAWLNEELGEGLPDASRAGAAWAIARFGVPWSETASAAVRDAWAAGDPLVQWQWSTEPLGDIIERVPGDDAVGLARALVEQGTPPVAQSTVYAVHERCVRSRSARERFAGLLADAVDHPDVEVRENAADAVKEIAEARPSAAGPLARYVAAPPDAALADRWSPEGRLFATALAVLISAGDHRWREPLTAALSAGWFDAEAIDLLGKHGAACDPALLTALRRHLAGADATSAMWNEPGVVIPRLLATWGPEAADAIPELLDLAQQESTWAMSALEAFGPAAADAVPVLLTVAATADWYTRSAAAKALAAITGDPGHLTRFIEAASDAGETLLAARTAKAHDLPLDALLPALGELARTDVEDFGARQERIEAATLLLELTGETDLPLLAAEQVLARGQRPAVYAADLAGRLGPAAAGLSPALHEQSPDRLFGYAAALAIRRINGEPEPLLAAIRTRLDWAGPGSWLAEAMRELGDDAAPLLPELRELAERDETAVTIGIHGTMIAEDVERRALLRELLAGG